MPRAARETSLAAWVTAGKVVRDSCSAAAPMDSAPRSSWSIGPPWFCKRCASWRPSVAS